MDRIGPKIVLMTGLIAAALLFIPMTLTNSPWMLAFWRFLLGFANAALMPAAQTILTLEVPTEAFGRVFSYNQSFQAAGSVLGALLGSTISGLFSYSAVFAITGCTLLLDFLLVYLTQHRAKTIN